MFIDPLVIVILSHCTIVNTELNKLSLYSKNYIKLLKFIMLNSYYSHRFRYMPIFRLAASSKIT